MLKQACAILGKTALLLSLNCSVSASGQELIVDATKPAAEVSDHYLSVALDVAQVVGAQFWAEQGTAFDFNRQALVQYTRPLAPGYLRIGGTDADRIGYFQKSGYDHFLTKAQWRDLQRFTKSTGLTLMFTANAGPDERKGGVWQPQNVTRLLKHAQKQGDQVAVWEFGNEVNSYWALFGPHKHVSASQYATDFELFAALVRQYAPNSLVAGPASAYWPRFGETSFGWSHFLPEFLKATARGSVDIVTWHFYPTQAGACPVHTRSATIETLLKDGTREEISKWDAAVRKERNTWQPQAQVWLGETGSAQCGGEPGVSDRYASSLWWADQLGRVALSDTPVMVRQTLVGSHYSLLASGTLKPRPDYWVSVLWNHLMGRRALATRLAGQTALRSYAHCARGVSGGVTYLLINTSAKSQQVTLPSHKGTHRLYRISSFSPKSERLFLNAEEPRLATFREGKQYHGRSLRLESHEMAFLVAPHANAQACKLK